MKTTIYYFSGTGNSLKIAKDLTVKLENADVVSITSIMKKNDSVPITADKIGIIYPVYIWGIPKIVSKFIKKIQTDNKGKYFFAIATCGGKVAGSLLRLSKELSSKGFKLSLGFSLVLPSNYIPYIPKDGDDTTDNQQKLFTVAEKRLDEITSLIKNNKSAKIEKGSLKDCLIQTGLIYRFASTAIHKMDKGFWTTTDCISCGLCEKICPMKNIVLKDDTPIWLHKCEMCFRCLNYCPKNAIQFMKNTEGKKRYKNNFVSLNEIID
ncbi:EFR1 family ferrodoxin [Clostridium sp. BL-8]|uniref:EFR1 family ferrodoxin n=1 Tax=Clostridium sp. BL-8 TaxID=349938 RepID=UPI00098BFC2E|nr:EFR1 family ferrodoxin [Clostridium sp. BL-8]OOM77047.1 NAD(P)H-quinone oxidoreductase subunit I [Clostridium sp. BL-8]